MPGSRQKGGGKIRRNERNGHQEGGGRTGDNGDGMKMGQKTEKEEGEEMHLIGIPNDTAKSGVGGGEQKTKPRRTAAAATTTMPSRKRNTAGGGRGTENTPLAEEEEKREEEGEEDTEETAGRRPFILFATSSPEDSSDTIL